MWTMSVLCRRLMGQYLTGCFKIELTSAAASEQSRKDCEAICKLGLKAKVISTLKEASADIDANFT